ncbi:hypothetical protein [Streptomyces sp. 11-1-2]|nr:hypothetical protein [Streptomyces sp. 11-1-2]
MSSDPPGIPDARASMTLGGRGYRTATRGDAVSSANGAAAAHACGSQECG